MEVVKTAIRRHLDLGVLADVEEQEEVEEVALEDLRGKVAALVAGR